FLDIDLLALALALARLSRHYFDYPVVVDTESPVLVRPALRGLVVPDDLRGRRPEHAGRDGRTKTMEAGLDLLDGLLLVFGLDGLSDSRDDVVAAQVVLTHALVGDDGPGVPGRGAVAQLQELPLGQGRPAARTLAIGPVVGVGPGGQLVGQAAGAEEVEELP